MRVHVTLVSRQLYPSTDTTHPHLQQVTGFTKTLPGGLPVSGFASSTSAGEGMALPGASSAAAALTVVSIDASALVVKVAPSATTIAGPPPVDLSKIGDTTPPIITLQGDPYVAVLEYSSYTDSGVQVYDNIDGYSISPRTTIKLCTKPGDITAALGTEQTLLSCMASTYGFVNTTMLIADGQAWLLTYTAKDAAGNVAKPLRRWVDIQSR